MSQESTTPALAERVRLGLEAMSRRDLDAVLRDFAPDAVLDMPSTGLGSREGLEAIREFLSEWMGAYEEFEATAGETVVFGNVVTLSVMLQKGRLVRSSGNVQGRFAAVAVWVDGLIVRVTNYDYADIDKARAAAERLAEERG